MREVEDSNRIWPVNEMKKRDVILNTQAHRPAFDEFVDLFHEVECHEGMRPFEILGNWMEASYRAHRGAILRFVLADEPAWAANEERYMRIAAKCRHPATMTTFGKMLGALALALETAPIDFIGPVFTSLAADHFMGQFFTPYEVSKMMAEMTLGEPDPEKPVTFCSEPACGVGGMVLAANEVFRGRGFDIARRVHWDAVDIDARAMHGAFLQINLTGASARVVHGDSLRLDAWEATPTIAAVMFPKRRPAGAGAPGEPAAAGPSRAQDRPGAVLAALAAAGEPHPAGAAPQPAFQVLPAQAPALERTHHGAAVGQLDLFSKG